MKLPGDSTEYELLTEAARKTTCPGLLCEVGCRLGAGVCAIVDGFEEQGHERYLISIDPYGGLLYMQAEGIPRVGNYDNDMLAGAMTTIPEYCYTRGVLWLPFIMTDQRFFQTFPNGIPVYAYGKEHIVNSWAFVHLDAQHTLESVRRQIAYFAPFVTPGGVLAFDDIGHYDHKAAESFLMTAWPWWETEEIGRKKAIYRRKE